MKFNYKVTHRIFKLPTPKSDEKNKWVLFISEYIINYLLDLGPVVPGLRVLSYILTFFLIRGERRIPVVGSLRRSVGSLEFDIGSYVEVLSPRREAVVLEPSLGSSICAGALLCSALWFASLIASFLCSLAQSLAFLNAVAPCRKVSTLPHRLQVLHWVMKNSGFFPLPVGLEGWLVCIMRWPC